MVHQVEHQLFQDHAQTARSHFARHGFASNGACRLGRKVQANVFVFKEPLILFEDSVARLGENLDERSFVKLVEDAHNGQAAYKLGNEAVLDEILRLGFAEQLGIAMGAGGGLIGIGINVAEAEG